MAFMKCLLSILRNILQTKFDSFMLLDNIIKRDAVRDDVEFYQIRVMRVADDF